MRLWIKCKLCKKIKGKTIFVVSCDSCLHHFYFPSPYPGKVLGGRMRRRQDKLVFSKKLERNGRKILNVYTFILNPIFLLWHNWSVLQVSIFEIHDVLILLAKTSDVQIISCFQDRMLKFCMKSNLNSLHSRLGVMFHIQTF